MLSTATMSTTISHILVMKMSRQQISFSISHMHLRANVIIARACSNQRINYIVISEILDVRRTSRSFPTCRQPIMFLLPRIMPKILLPLKTTFLSVTTHRSNLEMIYLS